MSEINKPLPDGLINPASFKQGSFRATKDGKWVTYSLKTSEETEVEREKSPFQIIDEIIFDNNATNNFYYNDSEVDMIRRGLSRAEERHRAYNSFSTYYPHDTIEDTVEDLKKENIDLNEDSFLYGVRRIERKCLDRVSQISNALRYHIEEKYQRKRALILESYQEMMNELYEENKLKKPFKGK